MYDPKGGNKPAYEPPAGTEPYDNKPPAEQPPYQKSPEQETPYQKTPEEPTNEKPPEPCKEPHGKCDCPDWDIPDCPTGDVPFRRLLAKLEALLEELSKNPTDATKKFADDLKDADKEYQGIVALVTKYKDFYDKLDCKLAEARSWKEEIDNWLAGKVSDAEKKAIETSRETDYDAKENKLCCDWIKCRDRYNTMLDCLERAKKNEEEAKEDYDAIKGLEKTLSDRFTDLKSLYDKAKSLRDEERFKGVYAVRLEYQDVFDELSIVIDWWYRRGECNGSKEDPCVKICEPPKDTEGYQPKDPLKANWPPERFKCVLTCRLRLLLLAKYQRFRWQHDFLTRASENLKMKEACEKFRKDRRDQFIQEADDVAPSDSDGGGGYGKPEEPQPEPEYPGGQTPEYPPTQTPPTPQYPGGGQTPPSGQYPGGPGQQQPPSGGYPQTQPPTQQYPTGQKPEYPENVPPTDKYQGRPRK